MKTSTLELLSGIPLLPETLPFDPYFDRRGKLRHLTAVDMSRLSIVQRALIIRLSQPCYSDDYGAFATPFGKLPAVPGIGRDNSVIAQRALVRAGVLTAHPGGRAMELKGAYAYVPGFAEKRAKQFAWAKEKREEKRRVTKLVKRAKKGASLIGLHASDQGTVTTWSKDLYVCKNGALRPLRDETFMQRDVPRPKFGKKLKEATGKGSSKLDSLIYPMPKELPLYEQRMYPSFDVYDQLTPAQTCIRFWLEQYSASREMGNNDFGQVLINVDRLLEWLGKVNVNKLGGRRGVERQIDLMCEPEHPYGLEDETPIPHLLRVTHGHREYAFIRDFAQHCKDRMSHGQKQPRVMEPELGNFENSSNRYRYFCQQVRAGRRANERIQVDSLVSGTKRTNYWMSLDQQLENMLENQYRPMLRKARLHGLSDEELMKSISLPPHLDGETFSPGVALLFYHAAFTGQPAETLNRICNTMQDQTDKFNQSPLARFVFHGMTPKEYLAMRNEDAGIDGTGLMFTDVEHKVSYSSTYLEDKRKEAAERERLLQQETDRVREVSMLLAEENSRLAAALEVKEATRLATQMVVFQQQMELDKLKANSNVVAFAPSLEDAQNRLTNSSAGC